MKSPTSFFNGSVLRKGLTRFAPVWVLYTVCWILAVPLNFTGEREEVYRALNWINTTDEVAIFNMLYAGLCALLLFHDLFNARMCNTLHAMPMRREGWLLTHSLSALIFALIPYLAASILAVAQMPDHLWVVGLWLAVAMLQFLFFFGLAVFSVMCAGNILGMGAVYFILNFFFLLAYGMFYYLYMPLLHGIAFNSFDIEPFVPLIYLINSNYLVVDRLLQESAFSCNSIYWLYLFICAAISTALWGLSFVLYRRRKLECAGDFVAFRPVAPVFLIFYTLGVGTVLFMLDGSSGITVDYVFLAVGIIAGFFTGKMLLEKQLKVFKLKAFAQLLILCVVLVGSMTITWLDPAGITYYVPDAEEITGMRIYADDDYHTYRSNAVAQHVMATDPEEIQQLRQLHQQMSLDRDVHPDAITCTVDVVYFLKDGSTCNRSYSVDRDSELGQKLELRLSSCQQVFFTNDWETYLSSVKGARLDNPGEYKIALPYDEYNAYYFTEEEITGLMAALKADCDAGNMAQSWAFYRNDWTEDTPEEDVCWLYIESDMAKETQGTNYYATGTRDVCLHITTKCVNTVIYLETLTEM